VNHKRGLISFSGIDGAGKSTQIKLLAEYLTSKGKKIKTTEEMFGYWLLKPVIGLLRKTTGSLPDGPIKRNKNFFLKLWFIVAFIDIWLSFIFKILPMRSKYDFVIADRFYTDIWANLVYYGYLPNRMFSFSVKLLPKPDAAFMLQVKPKIVLRREEEFPPCYYNEQEKIYADLSDQIDFNIVGANRSPQLVFEEIKEKIENYYGNL